jgi:hypothetical protein
MPTLKSRLPALLAVPLALLTLTLAACLGNSGNSSTPPSGLQVYPGDAAISVAWNDDPLVLYWVFYAQDPTLTTLNWSTGNLLNAGVLEPAASPSILCNGGYHVVLNNPAPTPLYPEFFFTINGRTGTSPGGPGSALVSGAPRPAGGALAGWVPGANVPANLTSIGYAGVTACGYAGRPASGVFFAVGPGATVYSSRVAPAVAGPMSNPGNNTLTWLRGNTPIGFSEDLAAVAGYATAPNNPAAPALLVAAVGKGGTILRSADGQNWSQVAGVPTTNNLNAIAMAGTTFVAVGDGGVILTSTDAVTWTANAAAAAASSNSLYAVRCSGVTCVAAGAAGTTLWSSSAGATWTLVPFGTTDWKAIAYGNNNANADAVVSVVNGLPYVSVAAETINTWVIVDGSGNYAYSTVGGAWNAGGAAIAPSIVAIDYTTHFVALDSAGNTYASENGYSWQTAGASNLANATAMRSDGLGFVALSTSGANAASY